METHIKALRILNNVSNSDSESDNILRIALDIGAGMLKSGAETHRVEIAIEKICRAYGAEHVEVFSINSLILGAVRMEDGTYSSQSRRIQNISNDLISLERFNRLSRELCNETPDFAVVDEKIREIKRSSKYPFWLFILGNILAAGGFAVFFGGSWRDGIAAGIIGAAVSFISTFEANYLNSIMKTLIISFFAGTLACLSTIIGLGENTNLIAIGTIMLLVPGVLLCNAMRDLFSNDTLTGVLKIVQALILAMMISIGYALPIILFDGLCPTPVLYERGLSERLIIGVITSIVGTIGFALIFKIAPKYLHFAAIGGAVTYLVYELAALGGATALLASFFAAIFMATYSETCARILRAPTVIFLFTSFIPIVPGSALYYSLYNLLYYNPEKLIYYARLTGETILGMALGISLITILLGFSLQMINKLKGRKKSQN